MNEKASDVPVVTSVGAPRQDIALISPATLEEIERGEAVRVPGTNIWLHPRRCGMITDIGK